MKLSEWRVQFAATYDQSAARLRRKTTAIKPGAPSNSDVKLVHSRHDLRSAEFPLPDLIQVVLLLLGCEDWGRSEKTAWEIPFDFEGGVRCLMASRKLGMTLDMWCPEGVTEEEREAVRERILATLRAAISVAETDVLYPAIKRAAREGAITLRNLTSLLRGQYVYFRENAQSAFEGRGRLAPRHAEATDAPASQLMQGMVDSWNARAAATREGSFNAVAMVQSYFSYLEHYLSLALAFTDFDPKSADLLKLLGDRWDDKFKAVLSLNDPNVKNVYDRLAHVAEVYRNPMSHGAFDKRGPTVGVNLPLIGYMPMLLTGIENTPTFRIFGTFDDESFSDVLAVFDELDDLIQGPVLGNAGTWIGHGFDVFFDDEERANYAASPEKLEEFMERRSELHDRMNNMDW